MNTCPACQHDVQDEVATCPYCGVIFAKWRPRPPASSPSPPPAAWRPPTPNSQGNATIPKVINRFGLALLILAALAFGQKFFGTAGTMSFLGGLKQSLPAALTFSSGTEKPPTPHAWVSVPKTFSFTDVRGQIHSFSGTDNKPAVLAFWIDECGYSQNAMQVLNAIRRQFPESQLDVVGIFLNERGDSEIISMANHEGYFVTLAAAQPPGAMQAWQESILAEARKVADRPGATQQEVNEAIQKAQEQSFLLIKALNDGFGIRGAGRDIYIVDGQGGIHTVPAVDASGNKKSREEIIIRAEDVLRKIIPRA